MGSAGSKTGFNKKRRQSIASRGDATALTAAQTWGPESMVAPNREVSPLAVSGRFPADQIIMHAYGDDDREGSRRNSATGTAVSNSYSQRRNVKMANQIGDHAVRQVNLNPQP